MNSKQTKQNRENKSNRGNDNRTPTGISYMQDSTFSISNNSTLNKKVKIIRQGLTSIIIALSKIEMVENLKGNASLLDIDIPSEKIEILDLSHNDFSFDDINQYQNQNQIDSKIHILSDLKDLNLLNAFETVSQNVPNVGPLFNNFILKLKKLESLNLTSIKLSILPKDISQLTNLSSLILSENKLTSLPEEIGNLKNLKLLDLSCNDELEYLPKSLPKLNLCCCGTSNCKGLNIRDTPIYSNFENDDTCDKIFLIYIRKILDYEQNHSFELKLTIIGNSLDFNNYIHKILKTDSSITMNENIDYFDIISKEYIPNYCKPQPDSEQYIRFNIWNLSDKATDGIYAESISHPSFFIIGWDMSELSEPNSSDFFSIGPVVNLSDNIERNVTIWLDYIKEKSEGCQVLVIGIGSISEDNCNEVNEKINNEKIDNKNFHFIYLGDEYNINERSITENHKNVIKESITKIIAPNTNEFYDLELNQSIDKLIGVSVPLYKEVKEVFLKYRVAKKYIITIDEIKKELNINDISSDHNLFYAISHSFKIGEIFSFGLDLNNIKHCKIFLFPNRIIADLTSIFNFLGKYQGKIENGILTDEELFNKLELNNKTDLNLIKYKEEFINILIDYQAIFPTLNTNNKKFFFKDNFLFHLVNKGIFIIKDDIKYVGSIKYEENCTYILSGNDSNDMKIYNSGEIHLTATSKEKNKSSYCVTISSTDSNLNVSIQSITIIVKNYDYEFFVPSLLPSIKEFPDHKKKIFQNHHTSLERWYKLKDDSASNLNVNILHKLYVFTSTCENKKIGELQFIQGICYNSNSYQSFKKVVGKYKLNFDIFVTILRKNDYDNAGLNYANINYGECLLKIEGITDYFNLIEMIKLLDYYCDIVDNLCGLPNLYNSSSSFNNKNKNLINNNLIKYDNYSRVSTCPKCLKRSREDEFGIESQIIGKFNFEDLNKLEKMLNESHKTSTFKKIFSDNYFQICSNSCSCELSLLINIPEKEDPKKSEQEVQFLLDEIVRDDSAELTKNSVVKILICQVKKIDGNKITILINKGTKLASGISVSIRDNNDVELLKSILTAEHIILTESCGYIMLIGDESAYRWTAKILYQGSKRTNASNINKEQHSWDILALKVSDYLIDSISVGKIEDICKDIFNQDIISQELVIDTDKTNIAENKWSDHFNEVNLPIDIPIKLRDDEVVRLVSYPNGGSLCITWGRVLTCIASSGKIIINFYADNGSSGGPVFNRKGQLVGLLHGGFSTYLGSSCEPILDIAKRIFIANNEKK